MKKSFPNNLNLILIFVLMIISSGTYGTEDCPDILRYPSAFQINGNIRSYYFTRKFTNPHLPIQRSFSFGGKLNFLTEDCLDRLEGVRLGATMYTAQSLGLNSHNPARNDVTLPGKPLTVLGQAFLQLENDCFLTRIGNQLISTPWVNEADFRMIPATYQGVYAKITPITDFHLMAMRLTRFKGRINKSFSETNVYSPGSLSTPVPALANQTFIGTLAFGAEFKQDTLKTQVWAYQFYNVAKLLYGDFSYIFDTGCLVKPLIGAQLGYERTAGNIAFSNPRGSSRNLDVYGALLGAEIADGSLTVGYNNITKHPGAFQNGDILSPYTSGYISDPLYTTSMIAGLIEKAAGSAYKVTGQYHFFEKQLHILVSYARYYTRPFTPNTSEGNVDLTYTPNSECKNLSLRYRVGLLNHNPAFGRFYYHRFMFQYDFS